MVNDAYYGENKNERHSVSHRIRKFPHQKYPTFYENYFEEAFLKWDSQIKLQLDNLEIVKIASYLDHDSVMNLRTVNKKFKIAAMFAIDQTYETC